MIGAILGDIVGSIYEFDNIKTKDFQLFDKECIFTDDSVMTIAVAEGYYGISDDLKETALSYLDERLLDITERFEEKHMG